MEEIIHKANLELYGPKFCQKCQKVQPVQTFKLDGSDFSKLEGTTLNVGFTGSRVCAVCYHTIDTGSQPGSKENP